jgi:hypothetical protein
VGSHTDIVHRRAETSPRLSAKIRRQEDTKLSFASAAAGHGRLQAVRKAQKQAALDHELFVSVFFERRDARSAWRRTPRLVPGWRTGGQPGLVFFFVSSILRFFDVNRGYVSARQRRC